MKISLCITVFNEANTIDILLESVVTQTRQPDEIIIVDGGSTDNTVERIKKYETKIKNLLIVVRKGNRPFGRNESIRLAKGEIILITDAGCSLDAQWIEEITKPFSDPQTQVVSGYYAGKPHNAFEEALIPYVLVMPNQVQTSLFLPSTRSMAVTKEVWEKVGKFPEEFRWNEDFVFAKRLEKAGIPIFFAKKAIVYWIPRDSFLKAWEMFYAFAKGDAQAGIWRLRVVALFIRYALGILILLYSYIIAGMLLFAYSLWAMYKNYQYMKQVKALFYLPLVQFCADSAVLVGTTVGAIDRVRKYLP